MPNAHPFLSDDFYIPWSQLTADRIEADLNEGLRLAKENLQQLRDLPLDQLSYDNTFGALESSTDELDRGWGRLQHLDSVNDNEAQRAQLNAMLPTISAFYASIALDEEIWQRLKTFADSPAASQLSEIQKRFVDETCASFIDSGAALPADKKQRVSEIQSRLSELTQKFGENVLDSTNAWELVVDDAARLAGLPESAIAGALAMAKAKNLATDDEPKWLFNLQYPSMGPVLQYADDDSLRKEIWQANCQIGLGDYDNTDIIWEVLELRHEKAGILGFQDFGDLTLNRRMAKSGATAMNFTNDLHARIQDAFKDDVDQLRQYKAEKSGSQPETMQPWETGYWAEKRRQELYDFDEEALRPYFPMQPVMEGMFHIVSQLYNIRIQERDTSAEKIDTWHEDVQFFDIFDNQNDELLGSFYTDWYPRASKRGGAWMNSFETGLPPAGDQPRQPHLGLMCGNMTKPVDGKPALLNHREVETVFHEFGHLLHHLLGDVEIKSLSGTNVAWDFVELPSQIMENFCWERQTLDLFARHYDTGETIPEELFQKMLAARNYMSATGFMRQLSIGKLDLELHLSIDQFRGRDLDQVDKEILADYRAELATETPSIARRLSHVFSSPTGYAVGYYSYKWAEVLDADAFTRFQQEGILNPEVGQAFRQHILSKGNSKPADELYRNFMGRDPELTPLLERSGLA